MGRRASVFLLFFLILISGCVQQRMDLNDSGLKPPVIDFSGEVPQKFYAAREPDFRAGKNADIPVPDYSHEISSQEPIHLKNSEILEIEDTRYTLRNDLIMDDNATLIVRNSILEFDTGFAYQWRLSADGQARVIMEDSYINSPYPMNFEFRGSSSLTLRNVKKAGRDSTFPWMTFGEGAKAYVYNSKFDATLWDKAEITVDESPSVYLEIVFPAGSASDEMFDVDVSDFSFPNENEAGIGYRISIKNSTARGWGFTINPQSNIIIRNAHNVVTTMVAREPWKNRTVYLSGLRERYYNDTTWAFGDTSLRFVNVDAWQWSPLAYENNTVIVDDSHLADIAWGGGHGKVIINNSDAFFIRAREDMEILVQNSEIHSDVIAIDNSTVILVNTTVGGKIVQEGNGTVYFKLSG